MTRADLEAAAEEKYRGQRIYVGTLLDREVAAYIQGRLDQAEEDAQIVKLMRLKHFERTYHRNPIAGVDGAHAHEAQAYDEALRDAAAAIRRSVSDVVGADNG